MESASEAIWNPAVVGIVLATALLLTLVTVGVQFRRLVAGVRAWQDASVSALGAPLLLASSASMSTITAAALAVTLGGPGALVWMWIATLVGLSLPFGEAALTARYFRKHGSAFVRAATPLGPVLAVLFALGSAALGLVGGGLYQGHEVGAVWSLTMGTSATVGAALVSVGAAAIVFVPAVRRVAFVYLLPMAIALWVGTTLSAAFDDPLMLELALGDAWNQAFGITQVGTGAGSGAVATLLYHGVMRAVMAGEIGAGSSAMAQAEAQATQAKLAPPVAAGAAAMLVPMLTCGLVATSTALALLGSPASETVVVEAKMVPLERVERRGLRPSREAGQTIVLPTDSALEAGKHYQMVLRSNPRGHDFGRLLREENTVILPGWGITANTNAVVFRSRNPELAKRAAWDVRVMCDREVIESPGGPPLLKLTPKEEGVDFGKVISYFELDPVPYIPVDDFSFAGFVARGTSPDEALGEHLAMYEKARDERPFDPALADFFRAGFRGPFADDDLPRPPFGFVTLSDYHPTPNTIVKLAFTADPRGNALVSMNRAGGIEGPPWDFLLDVRTLVLRHRTDPAQDMRIPVTTKLDAFRVRFISIDPAWEDFRKLETMAEYTGPYALISDQIVEAEVHTGIRLPPGETDRQTLVPRHPHSEIMGPIGTTPYRPHPAEMVEAGIAGPFLQRTAVEQVASRIEGHGPSWGPTLFGIVALVLGATTTAAWSLFVRRGTGDLAGARVGQALGLGVIGLGFAGAFVGGEAVLQWTELAYAAAVVPTLIALVLLFSEVRSEVTGGGGDAET